MALDYDDFAAGGMSVIPVSRRMPYAAYKRTARFKEEQSWKPQVDSRNPEGTEYRYWDTLDKNGDVDGRGHIHEVRGQRIFIGRCKACDDVVLTTLDVSGPEFRGRGNPGHRGRWPVYCRGRVCQEARRQNRADPAEGMRRLRAGERRRDYRPRKADHELKNPRR